MGWPGVRTYYKFGKNPLCRPGGCTYGFCEERLLGWPGVRTYYKFGENPLCRPGVCTYGFCDIPLSWLHVCNPIIILVFTHDFSRPSSAASAPQLNTKLENERCW